MRKIILAAALTAALTLGAAPAFAAVESPSAVKVTTDISQIKITVPVDLPVTADANGGALKAVPTDYKLENISACKLKVDSIVATETPDWKLLTAPIVANTLPSAAAAVGDIELKLAPAAAGSAPWQVSTIKVTDPVKWSIAGRTAATDVPFPITITGSNSAVKKITDKAATAINIIFTVAPDTSV